MSNTRVGFFQTASTVVKRFLPGTCVFPAQLLLVTASSDFSVSGGNRQMPPFVRAVELHATVLTGI